MSKLMKLFLFLAAAAVSLTIAACSGTDRTNIDTDDPDKAFAIAMKSYEEKDYSKEINELFDKIGDNRLINGPTP